MTDVGSVKKSLIKISEEVLPKQVDFVPGHPIAGTENSGPEAGFKGLFKGGYCIITLAQKQVKRLFGGCDKNVEFGRNESRYYGG